MGQMDSTRHSCEGDRVCGQVKHKEFSIDQRKALNDYSGDTLLQMYFLFSAVQTRRCCVPGMEQKLCEK